MATEQRTGAAKRPRVRLAQTSDIRAGTGTTAEIRGDIVDLMLSKRMPGLVFYFDGRLDEHALRVGLARALAKYPFCAGRLRATDGGLTFVCDDSGARFSTADVDVDLPGAIAAAMTPGNSWLVDQVNPPAPYSRSAPLLTVRVCRLSDGNTALGCGWHHSLGDMSTWSGLLRAWSDAVEGRPLATPTIVPDRASHFARCIPDDCPAPPGVRVLGWGELAKLAAMSALPARWTMVQIYFANEEIMRMREAYAAAVGAPLTANDVVCAHMMTLIRSLDGTRDDRQLSVVIDVRRRFGLDPSLAGNLVNAIHVRCGPMEAPAQLAARVHAAVESYAIEHNTYHSTVRFLRRTPVAQLRRCVPLGYDPLRRTLLVTNWARFGLFGLRFGGRAPVHFSPLRSASVPWVSSIVDAFGGAGLLFSVTLPRRVAARLRATRTAARLHPFRSAGDPVPPLARALPWIA